MTDHALQKLKDVSEHVLALAKAKGASGCEIDAGFSSGLSVDVRLGDVETVEHYDDQSLGLTVYMGQQKGSASTSDLSEHALALVVEKACNIARFTEADPYAGLPDPALQAKTWPDLELYHPWDLSVEKAVDLARSCEAIALNQDHRIKNSEGSNLSSTVSFNWHADSQGFSAGYATSRHSLSCSVVAEENGQMQRDYDYTVARAASDLDSVEKIGKTVAFETVSRLGARRIKTQKARVLFRRDVATGLVRSFLSAISGGKLYRHQSFLEGALRQTLFPKFMNIVEDPFIKKGLGSSPFDAEGVMVSKRALVEAGVLQGYLLNTYSGRRLGMASTGNAGGAHNVFVSSTGESFDELFNTSVHKD
ncbi:MAG: metalloprotease PmbA [Gammaproteobacteria bacterium]|nr:metalloprotease PmbA [Gammaproteobacteria bacterium]